MYCPNCGQQQISDEMRFCSRCGLSLSQLAEWLAGGALPVRREDKAEVTPLSPRRKGIRRAAKLMFFSGALFCVLLVVSLIADEPALIIIPFAVFFIALVMMLYARLFSDKTAPLTHELLPALNNPAAQTSALRSGSARDALPPATNNPVAHASQQQVRTNELAQPSVTEHTTRLLDNE